MNIKQMIDFRLLIIFLSVLSCISCSNKPIMPMIKYQKPINFHLERNAYLQWVTGKQYSYEKENNNSAMRNYGLIASVIAATVNSIDRNNHPSQYRYSYGRAEQAIFMTSLKDVLEQNRVFKKIEFVANNAQASKDIFITINFKTSRVQSAAKSYDIVLNVDMIINSSGNPIFKKTYLVESNVTHYKNGFIDQQSDVSQKLLDKIILGIEEWHKITFKQRR